MSIERKTFTIPASGAYESTRGNFCLLLSATGAINVRSERDGTSEGFDGVSGGVLIRRVQPWDNLRFLGTPGIAVEVLLGHEEVERDEVDIRLQIATIAGTASVAVAPATAVADTAPVVRPTATQAALFAVSLTRKRITVFVDSNNTASCFARTAGGANNIAELQPGMFYQFDGRYAVDVRNDTGANATFYIFEEA